MKVKFTIQQESSNREILMTPSREGVHSDQEPTLLVFSNEDQRSSTRPADQFSYYPGNQSVYIDVDTLYDVLKELANA